MTQPTQADREAAAGTSPHNERWGMLVRAGHMDNDPLVRAFTAHRLTARREALEEAAKVVESLRTCGCNGSQGRCTADDPYNHAADEIRSLIPGDTDMKDGD